MMAIHIVLLLLAVISLSCDANPGPEDQSQASQPMRPHKDILIRRLLQLYEKDAEPPLLSGQSNTTVILRSTLLCVNMGRENIASIMTWMFSHWQDARLRWDPQDFGGVEVLRVSPKRIWIPDIRAYNALRSYADDVQAIAYHTGDVMWVPPVTSYVPCSENNGVYNCTVRIGSWSYSGDIIDINSRTNFIELDNYSPLCPFVVQSHQHKRNVHYYESVPEPFVDITASLLIAAR